MRPIAVKSSKPTTVIEVDGVKWCADAYAREVERQQQDDNEQSKED